MGESRGEEIEEVDCVDGSESTTYYWMGESGGEKEEGVDPKSRGDLKSILYCCESRLDLEREERRRT
tara:strand:+ start:469 stop:669 length:201 start_codon:yes stop_codon:yes gene_type:complete